MSDRYDMDIYGHAWQLPDVSGMMAPVRCRHCQKVYDLTAVSVIHRYADCTTYTTPCCGVQADDRKWKGMPDFTELDADGREKRQP